MAQRFLTAARHFVSWVECCCNSPSRRHPSAAAAVSLVWRYRHGSFTARPLFRGLRLLQESCVLLRLTLTPERSCHFCGLCRNDGSSRCTASSCSSNPVIVAGRAAGNSSARLIRSIATSRISNGHSSHMELLFLNSSGPSNDSGRNWQEQCLPRPRDRGACVWLPSGSEQRRKQTLRAVPAAEISSMEEIKKQCFHGDCEQTLSSFRSSQGKSGAVGAERVLAELLPTAASAVSAEQHVRIRKQFVEVKPTSAATHEGMEPKVCRRGDPAHSADGLPACFVEETHTQGCTFETGIDGSPRRRNRSARETRSEPNSGNSAEKTPPVLSPYVGGEDCGWAVHASTANGKGGRDTGRNNASCSSSSSSGSESGTSSNHRNTSWRRTSVRAAERDVRLFWVDGGDFHSCDGTGRRREGVFPTSCISRYADAVTDGGDADAACSTGSSSFSESSCFNPMLGKAGGHPLANFAGAACSACHTTQQTSCDAAAAGRKKKDTKKEEDGKKKQQQISSVVPPTPHRAAATGRDPQTYAAVDNTQQSLCGHSPGMAVERGKQGEGIGGWRTSEIGAEEDTEDDDIGGKEIGDEEHFRWEPGGGGGKGEATSCWEPGEGGGEVNSCCEEKEETAAAGGTQQDYAAAYARYMVCRPLSMEEEGKVVYLWTRLLQNDWLCWQLEQLWGLPPALLRNSSLPKRCLLHLKQQVRRWLLPSAADVRVYRSSDGKQQPNDETVFVTSPSFSVHTSLSSLSSASLVGTRSAFCEYAAECALQKSPTALSASSSAASSRAFLSFFGDTAASGPSKASFPPTATAAPFASSTAARQAAAAEQAAPAQQAAAAAEAAAAGQGAATAAEEWGKQTYAALRATEIRDAAVAASADLRAFVKQQQQSLPTEKDSFEGSRRMQVVLFILKHLRAAAAGRATPLPAALADAVRQGRPPLEAACSDGRSTGSCRRSGGFDGAAVNSTDCFCVSTTAADSSAVACTSSLGEPPSSGSVAAAAGAGRADSLTEKHAAAVTWGSLIPSLLAAAEGAEGAAEAFTEPYYVRSKRHHAFGEEGGAGRERERERERERGSEETASRRRADCSAAVAGGGVCVDTYSTLSHLERAAAAAGGAVTTPAAARTPVSRSSLLPASLSFVASLDLHSPLQPSAEGAALPPSRTLIAAAAPLLCLLRWFLAEQHADHLLQLSNLRRLADLRSPAAWYPLARTFNRKITLHAGPPNSGKTAVAVQRLLQAENGCYLAPLRLLAWEVYAQLQQRGVKVSLLTGQERRLHKGATHLCCTVEAAPLTTSFACGVVDEAQLVSSPQRGDAWTRALLGLPAQHLHVCCEERAVPLLQHLFSQCGEKPCVHYYQRLAPLNVDEEPVSNLDALRAGDCLLCFTRADVLKLKGELHARGYEVYAIYGQLPPVVKQRQAYFFNEAVEQACLEEGACGAEAEAAEAAREGRGGGEGAAVLAAVPSSFFAKAAAERRETPRKRRSPILVATDAIGLGMNLHIRRVVFHRLQKYAGSSDGAARPLTLAEIRQLAGRAGRRSGVWGGSGGLVSCMEGEDFERVKEAVEVNTPVEPLKKAALLPSLPQLIAFCEELERQDVAGGTVASRNNKSLQSVSFSVVTTTGKKPYEEQQAAADGGSAAKAAKVCSSSSTTTADSISSSAGAAVCGSSHGVPSAAFCVCTEKAAAEYRRVDAPAVSVSSSRHCTARSDYTSSHSTAAAGAPARSRRARAAAAHDAAQSSNDVTAAAFTAGGIQVPPPPFAWSGSCFSYAEAIRTFINLHKVDPLYYVPPHRLNTMLTILHTLSDVPLPRQELFTFCLAPLPFSSPLPFLKPKGNAARRQQQPQTEHQRQKEQQRQSTGGALQAKEQVSHREQRGAAEEGGEEEGAGQTRVSAHVFEKQPAKRMSEAAAAANIAAADFALAQPTLTNMHTPVDVTKNDEAGGEETQNSQREGLCRGAEAKVAATDGLRVEESGMLSATALAAAGLSVLLVNALRTFAVLLATCGHVPLPPHVFAAASDAAASFNAVPAGAAVLHPEATLIQQQQQQVRGVEKEQRLCVSLAEKQLLSEPLLAKARQHQHRSQQENVQGSPADRSKPAVTAAVNEISWWSRVYTVEAAEKQEQPLKEQRRVQQQTVGETSVIFDATIERGWAANGSDSVRSQKAKPAAMRASAEAPSILYAAKRSEVGFAAEEGVCGGRFEAAEAVETIEPAEKGAEEEEKRYAERLLLLEENYQIVDLYVWLARKFPVAFVDLSMALRLQQILTEAIDVHLISLSSSRKPTAAGAATQGGKAETL